MKRTKSKCRARRGKSQPVGRPPLREREPFRGDLLAGWMDDEGLSAEGLSRALRAYDLKVTKWAIYKWLDGVRKPSDEVRIALAKEMQINVHRLDGNAA